MTDSFNFDLNDTDRLYRGLGVRTSTIRRELAAAIREFRDNNPEGIDSEFTAPVRPLIYGYLFRSYKLDKEAFDALVKTLRAIDSVECDDYAKRVASALVMDRYIHRPVMFSTAVSRANLYREGYL